MATKKTSEDSAPTIPAAPQISVDANAFVQAIMSAVEAANGPRKKTILTRKNGGPFAPKDGEIKPKLKRKTYQHGVLINEESVSSAEINSLNKLKPGSYCDGLVRVERRRDKGLNLTYNIRTAAQRLKLLNEYGLTSLVAICERCAAEAAQPKKQDEDLDD